MSDFILQNEGVIRFSVFAIVLLLMLALETAFPRKTRTQPRFKHIMTNLGIVFIYTLLLRLVFLLIPIGAAVGAAHIASLKGWGLFGLFDWPIWIETILAIILLDMAVYWQHVASHKIPLIWNFHKVHHADRDIDATTGIRFHPIEILASMFYKILIVFLLGPSVLAVILFELILNGAAMFNHANIKLPQWLDKVLRLVIVTPDFHRVHHSVYRHETDSNYGFNLSVWDRIFNTYIAQPKDGHDKMIIGLKEYQNNMPNNLTWCLKLPFSKSNKGGIK